MSQTIFVLSSIQSKESSPLLHQHAQTNVLNDSLLPGSKHIRKLSHRLSFNDVSEAEQFRMKLWKSIIEKKTATPFAVSFVNEKIFQTPKKLCVFDMDSTIINEEVIDEMARKAGIYDQVSRITEEAMQGKFDFKQSFRKRCALLKGMPMAQVESIIPSLSLSKGVTELVANVQSKGMHTAIVSGGFQFALKHFQKTLWVNEIHAHELLVDSDQRLTGEVIDPIIDANRKQGLVSSMKKQIQASRDETIVVGDGANDLLMMAEAGTTVSFCGKPKLSSAVNTLILDRNMAWLAELI